VAGRLTPGWRKAGSAPSAAPARPAPAAADAPPMAADLDHTEAFERWASTAPERPSWMTEPPAAPVAPAPAVPVAAPVAVPEEPPAPEFDDATDRFAVFAMRAAESRSLFAQDPELPPLPARPASAEESANPATDVAGSTAPLDPPGSAPLIPAQHTGGWRPDDVHVSSADIDADALRLEMLAARAAELRESHGDFAMPAGLQPFTTAQPTAADAELDERAAFWRKDAVAVSAEEFDADAARLETLASRAAESRAFTPQPEPEPAPEIEDERVAFWRKDAVVVTADEFDADAARLESLAARGPVHPDSGDQPALESTPFWEQQERLRAEAEQRAAAEAAARDAAANDEWQSRWERMAEEAARRGETPDPLGS